MDNKFYEQHFILILILTGILFLTYCAIPPEDTMKNSYKISKKMQARILKNQKKEKKIVIKETLILPGADSYNKIEEPLKKIKEEKGNQPVFADIILMKDPHYKKHRKGIVHFTHKKHVKDYAIACGSCHHDKKGTPLDLEMTSHDRPAKCIECHSKTRKPKDKKLGRKEKIAGYHFEALHAQCIGCHKKYNKKTGGDKAKGPAPSACKNCHLKK